VILRSGLTAGKAVGWSVETPRALMLVFNPLTHDARVMNEARSLAAAGYRVVIYGTRTSTRPPLEDSGGGVKVRRLDSNAISGFPNSTIGKFASLFSWWLRCYFAAGRQERLGREDIIHAHDLDTLPVAILLRVRHGCKLVFDAHEIYGMMNERSSLIQRGLLLLERFLSHFVDYIITVNEPLGIYFAGFAVSPVAIVRNAKPAVRAKMPTRLPGGGNFILTYIGRIDSDRHLESIINAVDGLEGVELVLGGDGDAAYIHSLLNRMTRVTNAKYVGEVSLEEADRLIRQSDCLIRLCSPENINDRLGLPNKVFEAISNGKPIIVTKGTYAAQFVEDNGIGIAVENDAGEIRAAIQTLIENPEQRAGMGQKGLILADAGLSWSTEEKTLLKVYESLKKA